MYSENDLEAAVAGRVLTADQAAAFREFVAAGRPVPAVDEEHFRLLTGFNDIFVGIAAMILLVAVGWIGQYVPPYVGGDGPSPFAGLFVAATAWGLAEFFTRKRRMALPSIILLLAFAAGRLRPGRIARSCSRSASATSTARRRSSWSSRPAPPSPPRPPGCTGGASRCRSRSRSAPRPRSASCSCSSSRCWPPMPRT